jgi:hypothetical protein
MRPVRRCALAALAATLVLNHAARAADLSTAASSPAAPPTPAACGSVKDFLATDCPLTWNGITLGRRV